MAQIGRHARRPEKKIRHVRAALGLTAASVAGTAALLGPATAANASSVNWDAIAQCESSGNWSINTGNGFYGGLQFTKSTWRAYGGTKFAPTANKASRSQQIQIAEKVLKGQGIGAWPVCGKKGGSTKHYTGTNTGGSAKKATPKKAAPHKSSTHKSSTHKVTPKKTTHHKVTPAPHRSPAPHKATTPKNTGSFYIVRAGDTLSSIAKRYHIDGGWERLAKLNADTVQDPNLIFPGQRIAI